MASLNKDYSQEKLLGQVYTPKNIVCKILEDINYNDKSILGKKIIDPACGDGRFLTEVVKRIIQFSPKEGLEKNLSYVYGWDIDEVAIQLCRKNLDELIIGLGFKVNWNIKVKNTIKIIYKNNLFKQKGQTSKYDFIVGNPPYVRVQHLDEEERNYIQEHYDFCKEGSTDIYIAFFELAYKMLKTNGKCSFITPNTFFIQKLPENNSTNYGHIKVFIFSYIKLQDIR